MLSTHVVFKSLILSQCHLKSEHYFIVKSCPIPTDSKVSEGSGCGRSGWRYEHLRFLIVNCSVSDLLYKVCSVITRGQFPQSLSCLLSASRLIKAASFSQENDVRPIAVGEVLRSVATVSLAGYILVCVT